ncbi:SOS response-associated peptidase family protein [Allosphingosinicella indica]|uniref:Abasic site processing protein n=1 Tax=Allosphingosinicella indica TaxID=941907 RepID=A0A1X7GJ48_9SPHN|nr:SOS response-associated peptidase family protein [Allosphingosinicella indica]SMF70467.1 Putative SOS response-associated peptidase YedK [Allosphingosinicella indica]
MCNHYRAHPEDIEDWREWAGFNLPSVQEDMDLRADVWPKRPGLVARIADGERVIEPMIWGVPLTMPGKRPGTTITKNVTNVRNLSSRFWMSMLKEPARRCLVPFSRFAEPKPGKDPETGRPAEYWFTVRDRPMMAFAGIWRPSDVGNVYAFLTCEPNPLVAPLHPKAMPVILHREDYDRWLLGSVEEACALAAPFPSQMMELQ